MCTNPSFLSLVATNSKGVDTNDIVDADALPPGWWGPAFGMF
jgi:hypothetical protein